MPSPRPLQTRTARLTRVTDMDGRTLYFTMPAAGRQRSGVTFLDAAQVPPFDGDSGWFEVEKVRGVPWAYWRAIRQVDGPRPAP